MKVLTRFITLMCVVLILISCEDDPVSSSEELVAVEVHLQSGLEGDFVVIEIDGDNYFYAYLSESVPIAGPLAKFSTFLPRGQNHFITVWGTMGDQDSNMDSVDIQFDNAEKYYLGVNINADTLIVLVQDSPFLYL